MQLIVDCNKLILCQPVAERSKVWVCGRSLAGIVGSNPGGGQGCLSLVSVVCCQVEVSASGCRPDHSSRGVLPSVVRLSVIMKRQQWVGHGPLGGGGELLLRDKKMLCQAVNSWQPHIRQLVPFAKIIIVWCENQTTQTNTLCWRNSVFLLVKVVFKMKSKSDCKSNL